MAKSRSIFLCNQCGAESSQYYGRCPQCQGWNTLVEQALAPRELASNRVPLVADRPLVRPNPGWL